MYNPQGNTLYILYIESYVHMIVILQCPYHTNVSAVYFEAPLLDLIFSHLV